MWMLFCFLFLHLKQNIPLQETKKKKKRFLLLCYRNAEAPLCRFSCVSNLSLVIPGGPSIVFPKINVFEISSCVFWGFFRRKWSGSHQKIKSLPHVLSFWQETVWSHCSLCAIIIKKMQPLELSHHLRPLHCVLVWGGVPVGISRHVAVWGDIHPLCWCCNVPDWGDSWRSGGQGSRDGQGVAFVGVTALFQQFLVFGPLVLEPDFHLRQKTKKTSISQATNWGFVQPLPSWAC